MDEKTVLEALLGEPMAPKALAERLGAKIEPVMRVLADLEVSGHVVRLPDGRYALKRGKRTTIKPVSWLRR